MSPRQPGPSPSSQPFKRGGKPTDRPEKRLRIAHARLEAQIRRAEAVGQRRQRSQETRRKVLIGVLVMRWMKEDPQLRQRVYAGLEQSLTRPVDRAVFAAYFCEQEAL